MSCARRPVLLVVAGLAIAASAPAAGDSPHEKLATLRRWLAAVDEHQAGRRDGAVERIGGWTNSQLDALTPSLEILTALLPSPANPDVAPRVGLTEEQIAPLRQLAKAEAARGDVNRIMKRGALLHADIMMAGAATGLERISAREARRETSSGGRVAVLGIDGQHAGFALIPRHWSLARLLLDGVHPDPSGDDFVRLWYRATSAYMLQRSQWGDAERHLKHARERLTPDANVHLDTGCLYEAYANPRVQSLVSAATDRGVRFDVRPAPDNLRLAEMHFKQATVLDPTLIEARVRLAKVRTDLGRAAEAVPDLSEASIAAIDPAVRYYAVLFLGQAEESLGHLDSARAAYRRAATLYPTGQAPHLALSLLALEAGDRETARFALRNFLDPSIAPRIRSDPWWAYHMGGGRNLYALVSKLWTALPRVETR